MAPNRKQISAALSEPTQLVVQAKYLPLTQIATPTAAPQQETAAVTLIRSSVAPSVADDYWNWSAADTIKSSNNTAEPEKDFFSAAHFEENAIRDYQRRQEEASTQTFVRATTAQKQEPSYWEERVESFTLRSDANARVGNTTGYWDWPEESRVNALQIALILHEELARQQMSAAAIEQRLVRDATVQSKKQYYETKPEHDDYWAWSNPTTVRAAPCDVNESYWEWESTVPSISTKIASLLEYETNRSLFSVDHYVALESHAIKAVAPTVRASAVAESQGYWDM